MSSRSFVSSNKLNKEIDMGHLHHKCSGQRREITGADVSEEVSPIQKTQSEHLLWRRRLLGQRCKILTTDVPTRAQHGRRGALGHRDEWESWWRQFLQPAIENCGDEVRTGKFKIRQTHGHALPEKQDPEYNLAVTFLRERERQMIAGSDLVRGRVSPCLIIFIILTMGRVMVNLMVWQDMEMDWQTVRRKTAFSQFVECLWRIAKCGHQSGVKKPCTLLHSCLFQHVSSLFVPKFFLCSDVSICSQPTVV